MLKVNLNLNDLKLICLLIKEPSMLILYQKKINMKRF